MDEIAVKKFYGEEIAKDLFKNFTATVSVQNLIDYFKQKEHR